MLYDQTELSARLLKMMANHLETIRIMVCWLATMKPLGKFRNLQLVELDFGPLRYELTFLYENCRTLKKVLILTINAEIKLLRTTTVPNLNKILML